jgi:hypothetical protein
LSKYVALKESSPKVLEQQQGSPILIADTSPAKPAVKRRKAASADAEKARTGEYKPKFNSALNLGELASFYDTWAPANNSEKILVFATFIRDRLEVAPCSADDIYTCFFTLKSKTKTPEAFVQAFRDAHNKTHFIDFVSLQEIRITIAGDNHFNAKLQSEKGSTK